MDVISIADLHDQTSEILRRVRDEGVIFEVKEHGQVVARLTPAIEPQADSFLSAYWERWDDLTHAISARWPDNVSAVDVVREGRREF
ncbi:MAG: type II toxin-antitoxin system Phd/YefM family antitoxin [Dehalococcoidia bacterium]